MKPWIHWNLIRTFLSSNLLVPRRKSFEAFSVLVLFDIFTSSHHVIKPDLILAVLHFYVKCWTWILFDWTVLLLDRFVINISFKHISCRCFWFLGWESFPRQLECTKSDLSLTLSGPGFFDQLQPGGDESSPPI